MSTKIKVINGFVSMLITIPIWFYLLHSILVEINATDLQFFLFWVYVPFTMFVHMVKEYANDK